MNVPDIKRVKSIVLSKGYQWFENGDYNLNFIGIRSSNRISNSWDDLFLIIFKVDGIWKCISYKGTTDPGQDELTNPSFPEGKKNGTAIVAPGQYRKLWKVGKHHGYRALQQIGKILIYRDANRDKVLDMRKETLKWWGPEAGINHHSYWGKRRWYDFIYNWSAGCQVAQYHADSEDWNRIMDIFVAGEKAWGQGVTYTLLEEGDFE